MARQRDFTRALLWKPVRENSELIFEWHIFSEDVRNDLYRVVGVSPQGWVISESVGHLERCFTIPGFTHVLYGVTPLPLSETEVATLRFRAGLLMSGEQFVLFAEPAEEDAKEFKV